MLTLYSFGPAANSLKPMLTLFEKFELGRDFTVHRLNPAAFEHHSDWFKAINPRGQVPALVLPDGTAIAEGTAILLHIADAVPGAGLAPPPGTFARAHHDRWLLFLQANVYEGVLRQFYADRYTADPAGAEAVSAAAEDYVKQHFELFEAALGEAPFACGERLSVLDLYLWMLAQWVDQDWLADSCPKIRRLSDRVANRPLIAPVHQRHSG